MAIGKPMTVMQAVDHVAADHMLLPGIQRNFVWRPRQISVLFDSLLRGYPIGTFLLWKTKPMDHPQLRFRRLVTDYHGHSTTPKTTHPPRTSAVFAVLDGQQRLTALNLGLRGTHATSETGSPRSLFLDLDYEAPDAGAEANQYRFEFLLNGARVDGSWFPVSDACGLALDSRRLSEAIEQAGIEPNADRRRSLRSLVWAVNDHTSIKVEIETTCDLDRVLNIFARTNTGGTKLTYVDLLVSTATTRWRKLDAGSEIVNLRRVINSVTPEGFRFTDDRIVKAGLVLLNAMEPKFHVESFMSGDRARRLEDMWPEFRLAMETAARMLWTFGLSGRSLPAENVIIPLAYYAHHRRLKVGYATAHSHEKDRRLVRAFVARTLLQRRYYTGVVDPVLVAARRAIRSHGARGFPLGAIEAELRPIKPIDVTEDFIDELCELRYGDRRTLTLLRMLFPHMVHEGPSSGGLDKDHVFPLSKFNARQLSRAGIPATDWDSLSARADLLPNLQLLRGEDNQGGGKAAKPPKQWLKSLSTSARRRYGAQDVKYLPDGLEGFETFWTKRRGELRWRIERLLAV
jgi:Protein of unknown function DUF262